MVPVPCIKNTVVFREGESIKYIYFIRSGEFSITKRSQIPNPEEEIADFAKYLEDPRNTNEKQRNKIDL